jgi:MerR family redox-sensitive transcriptional activator SoxR
MTIGEVARDAGVAPSTLRHWENVGLLQAPTRVGGKRRYDARLRREIALIVLIKQAGFTLAETRVLLSGLSQRTPPPVLWRELAQRKLPELRQTIAQASATVQILEQGLSCDCLSLADCVSQLGEALSDRRGAPTQRGPNASRAISTPAAESSRKP